MDNTTEKEQSNRSFWQLISDYEVKIPQLQRDYAQGREDVSITQIRETLIAEFFDSITNGTQLVLNFIYGEQKEGVFTPIDGQQRLTSLFLLHWYIFKRSNFQEGICKLKGFSYLTRDTSKRFCERICDVNLDFSKNNLKSQILDCYWFSGNFLSDPTIKSMLVVIDSIHDKFKGHLDFAVFKEKLINDKCPIIFLWLSMDDFNNTDDLYIKMNARGKLLSDFEIFKAKLQNSKYMEYILGNENTDKDKIIFISRYNNQFAELFYKYHQNQYDEAMMAFIMTAIRDDYFSYASENGVPQKDYRNDYKVITSMNGNVFYRFIEYGGFGYAKIANPEKIIAQAIKKVDHLLEIFEGEADIKIPSKIKKIYYDESQLFKMNFLKLTFEDTVVKYALYEYINKFGYPKSDMQLESYNYWKRYVFNIVSNTDFGGRSEDICDAMAIFRKMINSLKCESKVDVLELIEKTAISTAEMRHQQLEERVKAKLMMNDVEWNNLILTAEDYFMDGQIGFILNFSIDSNGSYSKEFFKKNFAVARSIFNEKKVLSADCDADLFERALLCMPDYSENHTAHLLKQSNSTTTWGFYKKDYSTLLSNRDGGDKRNSIKELFERLYDVKNINEELYNIISKIDISKVDAASLWKVPFIQSNLFDIWLGRFYFYNCIHLAKKNTEVLLLAGTTVRSYSMELNTFLLAKKMCEVGVEESNMQLHMERTGDIIDISTNFPLRYIEYKGTKTGYLCDQDQLHPYVHMDKKGVISRQSFEEAVELLKKM